MPLDPSAETPPTRAGPDRATLIVGLLSLLAIAGFVYALFRIAPPPPPDLGEGAHVLSVPLAIRDFTLEDHRGVVFDRARLEGHWSLLFFGYTYCPDICPVTLQKLAPVMKRLDSTDDLEVVFVSVDPERDAGPRLAEYVSFFHPDLLGATGPSDEIEKLTGAIGVYHAKAELEGGGDGYLVDHSSSLFLTDPEGRLHAILHEPAETGEFLELLSRARAASESRP